MSDRQSTLDALRRKLAGVGAPAAPAAAPAEPDDDGWTERLTRLRALVSARDAARRGSQPPLPGVEVAPGLKRLDERLPWPLPPSPALPGPADVVRWREARRERVAAGAALVGVDLETTGLSLGVGTRVFLAGIVRFDGSGWRLSQWLLTDPAAEAQLIHAVLAELPEAPVWLSYNGKGFDLPLLHSAARLAGCEWPAGAAHLDLLHPMRRRFRSQWPNCRLATAEHRLLGVERVNDLPGAEVPLAWQRWLHDGSTTDLIRAIHHHAQDLRSLVGLAGWLAQATD